MGSTGFSLRSGLEQFLPSHGTLSSPALSVVRTAKPVDVFRFSLIFISFSPFE
jgi:hypothetical protein